MYLGMCIYSYLPDFQYADAFSELVEPMTMEYITQFQKLSKELQNLVTYIYHTWQDEIRFKQITLTYNV